MSRTRRVLRIGALAFGGLLAALLLAIAAGWAAVNTEAGRGWLAARIEAAARTPEGRELKIGRLEGPLPQRLVLHQLRAADAGGTWLTIDRLELAWRPLALIGGRLHVERLTAGEVAVTRQPAAVPAAEDEPAAFALPRPPLPVRLDRLQIDAVRLAEAVLGQAAAFRVEGQAAAPVQGDVTSRLTLRRLDADGRLEARAVLNPDEPTLEIEAALDEPAGGLLARALEVPDLPPVSLKLTGEGPLDDWRGHIDGRLGDKAQLAADLAITGAEPTFTLDGTADVAGLLDADTARLLGGPVALDLRLRRDGPTGVRAESVRLTTRTLDARLRGRFDGDTGAVKAGASIALTDPEPLNALIAPSSVDGVSLRLAVDGRLPAPKLHVDASVEHAALPDAALSGATLTADYTPRQGPLVGELRASGTVARVETGLPAAQGFHGSGLDWRLDGRVDGEAQRLEAATLRVQAADTKAELSGGLDAAAGSGSFAVSLLVGDLARLEPLMGLGLTGRGEVDGYLEVGTSEAMLNGTLAGEVQNARFGAAEIIDALFAGRTALAADITMSPEGALRLSRIEVAGPRARVAGDVAFPAAFDRIEGDLRTEVPDASALSAALGVRIAGGARAEARLSGPTANPALDGRLTVEGAALEGTPLDTVSARVTARNLVEGVEGEVQLRSGSPVGSVRAAAGFAMEPGTFHLRGLEAEGDGFTVAAAQLAVPLAGGPLSGAARATLDDLAPLAARLGLDAGGRGSVDLRIFAADGTQGAEVTADLADLRLAAGEGEPLTVARASVTARGRDLLGKPRGTAEVSAATLALGPAELATLSFAADGGMTAADLSLTAEGDVLGPTGLEAAGRLTRAEGVTTLALRRLQGRIAGQDLALEGPATLAQAPGETRIDDLRLAVAGGRLRLDAALGDRIKATLAAESLPLSVSRAVLARPHLDGTLDARISLEGPAASPGGTLTATVTGLAAPEAEGLPPVDLTVDGTLSDGRLALEGSLAGISGDPVRIAGTLPLRVSAEPFAATLDRTAPLSAELAWQGEVAPLMPLVPASGHRLTGPADLALSAGGTLAAPELQGHLTLTDGEYENLTSGTLLRRLDLRIDAEGRRLSLTRLNGATGGRGSIEAGGDVALDPEQGFPVDLRVTATEARVVRRDEATARASGSIALAGSLRAPRLEGRLTVDEAELRIPDDLPPEVVDLGVVESDGGPDDTTAAEAPGPRQESDPPVAEDMRLDVTVLMPRRVFLRGRGLDSEWSGELHVTGTASEPVVEGEMTSVRGQISFLGKSFRLTRGQVSFLGGREIDPELTAVAEHSSADLQVTVEVSGPVSQPQLALSSVPELPQDEIVARLLFGKTAAELTPLEAVQLAAAVAELGAGGGGAGGLLDRLRDVIGVDVLRVGGTEEGGPSVTAGKYVTEDVFVGVEQGATPESGGVTVEVEVTPNILVESDVGQTGTSNVGVKFKWDY